MGPLESILVVPFALVFGLILLLLNALIFRAACALWGVDEPTIPGAMGIVFAAGVAGFVADLSVSALLGSEAGLSVGAGVVRVGINAIVTSMVYAALSQDVDVFTALQIYVGQLLVTGLVVGIVFAAMVGFASLSPDRLAAWPIAVVVVALLAGASLAVFVRRRSREARRPTDSDEDLLWADEIRLPKPSRGRPLKTRSSKQLQEELAAAVRSRMPRIEAVEEESRRLKAQVAALTRLLISRGVLTAEEIAETISAVRREGDAPPADPPPPPAPVLRDGDVPPADPPPTPSPA
jgi:hypothetical protein